MHDSYSAGLVAAKMAWEVTSQVKSSRAHACIGRAGSPIRSPARPGARRRTSRRRGTTWVRPHEPCPRAPLLAAHPGVRSYLYQAGRPHEALLRLQQQRKSLAALHHASAAAPPPAAACAAATAAPVVPAAGEVPELLARTLLRLAKYTEEQVGDAELDEIRRMHSEASKICPQARRAKPRQATPSHGQAEPSEGHVKPIHAESSQGHAKPRSR